MRNAWVIMGAVAAGVVPFLALPASAADQAPSGQSGMTAVAAEELNMRSKQPAPSQSGGLSSRGVRNMVFFAFSLIPDQVKRTDGSVMTVDKSDPTTFFIPEEDARAVIRAATRSAYADVCGLPDLGKANYQTMLAQEKAKQSWSEKQVLMIEALHLFAVSFFTGNASFTDEPEPGSAEAENAPAEQQQVQKSPPPPTCPPEQRQKVESAINAYVASAGAQ